MIGRRKQRLHYNFEKSWFGMVLKDLGANGKIAILGYPSNLHVLQTGPSNIQLENYKFSQTFLEHFEIVKIGYSRSCWFGGLTVLYAIC